MHASKRSAVLSLAPLLCALAAFPQSNAVSIDHANQPSEQTIHVVREKQILAVPTSTPSEYFAEYPATPTPWNGSFSASEHLRQPDASLEESPATLGNMPAEDANSRASFARSQPSKPPDFNRDIYYRNKLEFSLEGGWHPINIPFPLDIFVGDAYNTYPLKYTLVPIFASLRWHIDGIELPGFYAAIGICNSPGPSLGLPGDRRTGISLISWVFDVILSRVEGRSRPILMYASALGALTPRDPTGCYMRKDRTSRSLSTWEVECDTTSILAMQFRRV